MPVNPSPTPDQAISLHDLGRQIQAHHAQVISSALCALDHAMAAGDALREAKRRVNHGEWEHWLQRSCEINRRTARRYMQLATARTLLESNRSRATDLTIAGALKLLGNKTSKSDKGLGKRSDKSAPVLSSLAWATASLEDRRRFLDAIGLESLLGAIPAKWREKMEERAEGAMRQRAANADNQIVKALKQALSLQKSSNMKDGVAPGVAAALGAINNLLARDGRDLNDIMSVKVAVRAAKPARRAA